MGSHKKSKKARNRSRSRSRDSFHSESHKSSKSKRPRRRKSSSRSRSRSSSSDRYRSPSRSPERRHKKKSKKSRSRSKDRYSGKRGRSRSRSREYRSRRSRSGSSSRSRRKRRSRSRSHSKLSSRSKETSLAASPHLLRDGQSRDAPPPTGKEEKPLATLQEKMQKALEAAATADAQLREQGILTSMTRNEILTQKEERDRQKQLAAIEKDSFHSKPFQSSSNSANMNSTQQPAYGISRDLNHDSAIFSSTNNTADLENVARYLDTIQPNKNGKLASDLLSASKEEKEERWFQKLKAMRKQRLEGRPLAGQIKVDNG